jgi:predicted nucleotidyltransferase
MSFWGESAPGQGVGMQAVGVSTEELAAFFEEFLSGRTEVCVAYVFGSFAARRAGPKSDLDLAFLLDEGAYREDPFEAGSPAFLAATEAGMRFKVQTDVTILNGASLEMAYEIVVTGRCLYSRDDDERLEYETVVKGMYFDFRPFLVELRTNSLNRL